MHALTILQRCVGPVLTGIHRRRLAGLFEAVAATVSGPRLTLTEIGRRFGGDAAVRHRIKRAGRWATTASSTTADTSTGPWPGCCSPAWTSR